MEEYGGIDDIKVGDGGGRGRSFGVVAGAGSWRRSCSSARNKGELEGCGDGELVEG